MSGEAHLHATAIAIRDQGFLLLGASGSGKSAAAMAIIAQAQRENHFGALVADDQVFISSVNGRLIARSAESIRGLMEIRGAGIVEMPTISHCVLHFAVQLVSPETSERVPPKDAVYEVGTLGTLPLHYLQFPSNEPWFALKKILSHRVS